MSKQVDIEIVDYDIDYCDAIDGHVSDFQAPALTTPTTNHAAITQPSRGALVLPTQQAAPNPLAGALGHLMAPQQSNGQQDAYAIQHMQAMSEKSTPMERTNSKVVLMAWWIAIAGIVALGLNKAELIDNRMAWLCFVVAFAYGVYKSNADENAHSPAGVERHKTDIYGKIRITEIQAADKANERSHETFGKVVDKVYGGGDHAQGRITRKR